MGPTMLDQPAVSYLELGSAYDDPKNIGNTGDGDRYLLDQAALQRMRIRNHIYTIDQKNVTTMTSWIR